MNWGFYGDHCLYLILLNGLDVKAILSVPIRHYGINHE